MPNEPRILQDFIAEIQAGFGPRIAMIRALASAAAQVSQLLSAGAAADGVFPDMGISPTRKLLEQTRDLAGSPDTRAHQVCMILLTAGSMEGIPTPECMEGHLPRDRKPTRKEIVDAWFKCRA